MRGGARWLTFFSASPACASLILKGVELFKWEWYSVVSPSAPRSAIGPLGS